MRARLIAVLGFAWALLSGVFYWALPHLLWDWLIQFLEKTWHFKEAELIASISSYAVPMVGAALCVIAIYMVLRHEMARGHLPQLAISLINASKYMTAYEALHYLANESKWGAMLRKHVVQDYIQDHLVTITKNPLLEAPGEFRRIAQEGNIKAIGRLNCSGTHVHIPGIYWMSATLSYESLSRQAVSRTEPAVPNPKGVPTYDDVRISRKDVERTWPR